MSAQHTPGPWTVEGDRSVSDLHLLGSDFVGGSQTIATVYQRSNAPDAAVTQDANARLIAAAPELLRALNDLVGSFEKHRPKEYWDAARAAIAKATGERP